jgi:hypothetical protein
MGVLIFDRASNGEADEEGDGQREEDHTPAQRPPSPAIAPLATAFTVAFVGRRDPGGGGHSGAVVDGALGVACEGGVLDDGRVAHVRP